MVVLESNGLNSAKPLNSQDHDIGPGPSVPKPPPYSHTEGTFPVQGRPGYPNVRPHPVAPGHSPDADRRESPGMRFLKAFCVAILVWMLCGAFVRSLVWAVVWNREHRGGSGNGVYPIPGGVYLETCSKLQRDSYAANQSAEGLQFLPPTWFPYVSKAKFDLPISSDSLYLLERGTYASGSVDILTSPEQNRDSASVHVTVRYYHQEIKDLVKLCKISRRAGDRGVGIFTPAYMDGGNLGTQLYLETLIVLPQPTRRDPPLRIKNLETDVQNMFHRVQAIPEHVVFDHIILSGSNAPITSINLAADAASMQTSNGAILGTFNASKQLSLVTSNAPIRVDVHLDNDLSTTPSKLHIKTTNGPLEANVNLYASSTSAKGHYPQYEVDTKTSNNKLDVDFQNSPADSTLFYSGYTSNGYATVLLHAAYQGSFKVSTSSSWVDPELRVRDDAADPSGRGRKREVQHSSPYKGLLTGSVAWVDGRKADKGPEKGTVEVGTSNAKAVLVL